MVPCSGDGVAQLFSGLFAYESQWNTVSYCNLSYTVCSLSVGHLVNEHMLIQVSTWLLVDINTRSHKVLCHSAVDGVHASVTVGDVDAPTLSVQSSSNESRGPSRG